MNLGNAFVIELSVSPHPKDKAEALKLSTNIKYPFDEPAARHGGQITEGHRRWLKKQVVNW